MESFCESVWPVTLYRLQNSKMVINIKSPARKICILGGGGRFGRYKNLGKMMSSYGVGRDGHFDWFFAGFFCIFGEIKNENTKYHMFTENRYRICKPSPKIGPKMLPSSIGIACFFKIRDEDVIFSKKIRKFLDQSKNFLVDKSKMFWYDSPSW